MVIWEWLLKYRKNPPTPGSWWGGGNWLVLGLSVRSWGEDCEQGGCAEDSGVSNTPSILLGLTWVIPSCWLDVYSSVVSGCHQGKKRQTWGPDQSHSHADRPVTSVVWLEWQGSNGNILDTVLHCKGSVTMNQEGPSTQKSIPTTP